MAEDFDKRESDSELLEDSNLRGSRIEHYAKIIDWVISGKLTTLQAAHILEGENAQLLLFSKEVKVLAEEAEHLSKIDLLTGIFNRRGFLEEAEIKMRDPKTAGPYGVVLIDLDNFKLFNDRYGHKVGDEALVTTTGSVASAKRDIDVLGRWGGEEFVVFFPGVKTQEELMGIAERMRSDLESTLLVSEFAEINQPLQLTGSFGGYVNDGGVSLKESINIADSQMYLSKQKGRNQVTIYGLENNV